MGAEDLDLDCIYCLYHGVNDYLQHHLHSSALIMASMYTSFFISAQG